MVVERKKEEEEEEEKKSMIVVVPSCLKDADGARTRSDQNIFQTNFLAKSGNSKHFSFFST